MFLGLWAIRNNLMSDHKLSSEVYERSQALFQGQWAIRKNLMSDHKLCSEVNERSEKCYERSQALFQGLWAIRNFFMSDHKLCSKVNERSENILWAITSSVPRSMSDQKNVMSDQKFFYERSQALFQGQWAIRKNLMSDQTNKNIPSERSQNSLFPICF